MEISSAKWFCEMEMEEYAAFGYDQYHLNPLDYSLDELNFQSLSSKYYSMNNHSFNHQTPQNFTSESFTSSQVTNDQRPAKKPKTSQQASPSSSSRVISFDNSRSPPATSQKLYGSDENKNYEDGATYFGRVGSEKIAAVRRSPLHAIEERKRREKLSQRFIALSAVVPGLKKTDKASVLGDAVKYLKYLQERVNTLEEQATKKTMESVVFIKKSLVYIDDDSSSADENSGGCCDNPVLEIETRVSDKDVLIRILCEKQKGYLVKILSEIEKFNLNIINSRVMPFGNYTIDVTIVAQMDIDFSMTAKDLVRNLRQALV
ncbi:unnamed protein product [Dovyalis caffra]|uniref:BHLH domain-containing protein n=1 Tax=Dovyalis caffra TaxID=77055 RepID=A0AAV1SS53_9ROSI|nr:unnamed protein product [Dovyalis caffra]